ncbi:MAG: DUF58 domain-containing protein [Bacillota bacterium]
MNNQSFIPPVSIFSMGLMRLIVVVVLIILLRFKMQLPALVLFLLFSALESSRWWSRAGLRKLSVDQKISPLRLFPGDEGEIQLAFYNNKLLPVLLEWLQPIPPELIFHDSHSSSEQVAAINGSRWLKWHDKLTVRYRFQAKKRGYFPMPALNINSRDGLGLFFQGQSYDKSNRIIVYPRLIPLPELRFNPGDLIGDKPDRRPILPDPIRVIGLRDYTPGTPARLIHWKASTRQGSLMARVLEPSANLQLCVAIDVDAFTEENPFEEALSLAGTLACWAEEHRIPFGLYANASQNGLSGPVSISPSSGSTQSLLVLERLARMEFKPLSSLKNLLGSEGPKLPWGTTLFVIGNSFPETIPAGVRHKILYNIENFNLAPMEKDQGEITHEII